MKKLMLSLLAVVATALPVQAENFSHEGGGIQFDVPDGWKAEPDKEHPEIVTVSNPDGSMAFMFWVAENDDWEAAIDALDDQIDKTLDDIKVEGEASEGEHNGMKMVEMAGTGTLEKKEVVWSVNLLAGAKPVIVLWIAEPAGYEKDKAAMEAFLQSVRKL